MGFVEQEEGCRGCPGILASGHLVRDNAHSLLAKSGRETERAPPAEGTATFEARPPAVVRLRGMSCR